MRALRNLPKWGRPTVVTAARVSKFHRIGSKPRSVPSWTAFQLPPVSDRLAEYATALLNTTRSCRGPIDVQFDLVGVVTVLAEAPAGGERLRPRPGIATTRWRWRICPGPC